MKVTNIAPNQVQVVTEKGTYFTSYGSNIVFIPNEGKIQLGKNWDYSVTTSKYRNQFLGETTKETQAKIDSGQYVINPNL